MSFKNAVLTACISLFVMALFLCSPAEAQVKPGIRGGAYTDSSSGMLGGEVLFGLGSGWYFNPNAEFVFLDRADMLAVNFDVHYDLPTNAPMYFWVGAGPAILHRDPEGIADSRTDVGANLLFGVGFNKGGSVIPYIQPKVVLANDSEFSLAVGVRF